MNSEHGPGKYFFSLVFLAALSGIFTFPGKKAQAQLPMEIRSGDRSGPDCLLGDVLYIYIFKGDDKKVRDALTSYIL